MLGVINAILPNKYLSLLRVKYESEPEIESAGRLAMQIASRMVFDTFHI